LLAFKKAQNLSENAQKWGLILLGDGVQKTALQAIEKQENIQNIHWVEGQNWQTVPKYLALADVFVLPSKSEPWGLVVNEAMICDLPVIVSDRAGCSIDLVENNKNGFIFQTESIEDLSQKLLNFMDKKVNYEEMSQNSKKIIQNYSIENCAVEMLNAFENVLKKQ
jgi:glycosyltransferase involved in cell wall biosynthesis